MTTRDAFGRDLSVWLHEEGEHRVPDHLSEVLVQTVATRQRPWWTSLERWLPVELTFTRRFVPDRRVAWTLAILGVIIIVAVGLDRLRHRRAA